MTEAGNGFRQRRLTPSRATLWLFAGGLVIPNALAIAAGYFFVIQERMLFIALYALMAVFCGPRSRFAVAALLPVVLLSDIVLAVAKMFFVHPSEIPEKLTLLAEVDVLASPFYLAALAVGGAFLALNLAVILWRGSAMARGNRLAFLVAAMVAVGADAFIQSGFVGTGPYAGYGQPFQSAVLQSGFGKLADQSNRKRHVLLVIVESLGVLRDERARATLFSAFDEPDLKAAFTMTRGTTTFFGSTSHGEIRELCGSRMPYRDIIAGPAPVCLPTLFAAHGYHTMSLHGFAKAFFDRDAWYPKIGLDERDYRRTLIPLVKRRCGSAFPGPCDIDLADIISHRLKAATQPLFIHWLTLNSHVPVKPGQATRRHDCETGGPFGDPEVCAMAEIWEDLFAAVSRLALANPETEILLVGDHAPPLWRREARARFDPHLVPWLRLAPRGLPRPVEASLVGR